MDFFWKLNSRFEDNMSPTDFEDKTMKLSATEREHAESISALADGAHQDMSATVRSSLIGKLARDEADALRWARYHSIGDMLRSPDLAPTSRDEAFLTRMRLSLAAEPVVISPQGESVLGKRIAPQANDGRIAANRGYGGKGGSAARSFPMRAVSITGGLMAVAAIAASWSAFAPSRSAPAAIELSQAASPVSRVSAVRAAPADASPASLVVVQTANGAVIRDARLDQYFAAHSGVRSGVGLGAGASMAAPVAFVRSASIDSAAHQ
jgi:sigma-E factor negative regulatory protein RseA